MLQRLPGEHGLALEAAVFHMVVVGVDVDAGRASQLLIATGAERPILRTGFIFPVIIMTGTAGQRQVGQDVEIGRTEEGKLLVTALGVFTECNRRATQARNIDCRSSDRPDCSSARRRGWLIVLGTGRDRAICPIIVVLNFELFVIRADDRAETLSFGRGDAEFMALVRRTNLVGPIRIRRVAIAGTASIGIAAGALVECTIRGARIVGVIALRLDMPGQVRAGVQHFEIADFTVKSPGTVPVGIVVKTWFKLSGRHFGNRLIIVAVVLRRK